tara:strand:- start:2143 stop:2793 length:651 start_codon:yes stop_codon:yes gene_type:complete
LDWANFIGYAIEKTQIIKVIGSVWKTQFAISGVEEMRRIFKIARKDPFDFVGSWSNYSEILEAHSSEFIENMADEIAQTTSREMQRLVSDGLNEGLPIKDIADLINADKRFNTNRGQLIARTEATRLHANASLTSIKDSNSFGITVKKGWIGNLDDDTRDSHKYLIKHYGQKENAIYPDEYFVIKESGEKALGPGDFSSPAEVCNCRCAIKPVVID